jgi:hypothetical protein
MISGPFSFPTLPKRLPSMVILHLTATKVRQRQLEYGRALVEHREIDRCDIGASHNFCCHWPVVPERRENEHSFFGGRYITAHLMR